MGLNIPTFQFDAVIVGGGGAGLRAALQLAQSNVKVAVISKLFPTRSHTVSAQGGISAALGNTNKEDDWRFHMYDTVIGSDYLGDQEAIEYMCHEAPRAVVELEHMGLPFSRNDEGKIYQRAFGGQTLHYGGEQASRTCAAADRTGHALLHTLYQKNVEARTHFYNEWYAIDLVKSEKKGVAGVVAMNIESGELTFFHAKATVLATGGAGRIFQATTNAYSNTGDGLGMVLRAGFPLQDMEMWQFHPTGIAGVGCLISEATRGEGGYLINKDGERYMERYAPHLKDLACRDIVSRSSMIEIREGRGAGPNGDYVLLKLDHLGRDVLEKRLPGISELAKTFAGVDVSKEPIPVVPTCHYMMGGIPTNIHGQAITMERNQAKLIEGLYAVGECACVSVHGANRLGANSLLDLVVFGRAVGLYLAEHLNNDTHMPEVVEKEVTQAEERVKRWNDSTDGEPYTAVRADLQKAMQDHFGVFREAGSMEEGVKILEKIRERAKKATLTDKSQTFNTARVEALELDNLIGVAYASAVAADMRKESRGAHSRLDYPERDDKNFLKHSIFYEDAKFKWRSVNFEPKKVKAFKPKKREQ
jgi:succinate dehydrogenase / fumarate reductase, flavoprotein subunit